MNLKNPKEAGGLGLPCVSSKANSLFLKQTCRLLVSSDSKQYAHIKFWLGLYVGDFFPDMAVGPHAEIISPYFNYMRLLLVEGLVLGDIKVDRIRNVTSKSLYEGYTSSFPPPKVVFKFDIDWPLVWERLQNLSLEPSAREYMFSIVHNIVPNRDRLYSKMNMVNSPNCLVCGVREDNTHMFAECVMVNEAWGWVRRRALSLLPEDCAITSNFELLNLIFVKHLMDYEVVWLLGTYLELVWVEKIQKKKYLKINHLIGHTRLRYQANQVSKKPSLGFIANLS